MRRRLCLLLCFVLLMTGLPASFAKATEVISAPLVKSSSRNGMVRVYLSSMGSPTKLDVSVTGSYTADGDHDISLSNGATVNIAFNTSTGQITMTRSGTAYAMGQEMVFRRHAVSGASGLSIAQTRMPDNLYPGDLHLKAQQSGGTWRLYSIVHVYIEYYLYGVVPYEMGNSAHIEALKAQAVAARTYTLNKMNIRSGSLYDVVDTTNDQVYYGNSDSTANCTAAVDATKGIVLMNGSDLTGTYYTASNGGQTESAKNGFGSSGYSYLGVKDDPFDLMNSASVKRSVTVYSDNTSSSQPAALKNVLASKAQATYGSGVQVTRIHGITPHTPMYASPSRMYTKLDFDVTLSTGVRVTMTLDIFSDLEKALGMSINSKQNELWSVADNGTSFTLTARRFGHGVGMSQRGAMQMGSLGYTYDQILGFYYEDCRRVQHTFTHTVLSGPESGGDTIINTEPPADITQGSGNTATVKLSGVSDHLAIRGGASGSASVLTTVVNGGLVTVLAKGNDWTLVQLGQIVGYVPTSALKFSGTPPVSSSATPTVINQWATVQCNGKLNLRASASLSAGVKTSIPDGAVLCVFTTQDGWAHVQYGATVGWASMDFLKLSSVYPGTSSGEGTTSATVSIPSGSGTVNLRETASTTSRVLAAITHGSSVTVLTNDGSWCFVRAGGQEGYMMTKYLALGDEPVHKPEEDEPTLNDGEQEAIVKTASGTLNLREQPTTAARVLTTLPRGESIIVTNRGIEWCSVRYAGVSGYVMTKYLSFPADSNGEIAYYATVATQSGPLNMRKQPTTGSTVMLQIPKGTQVGVIDQTGSWSRIRYQEMTGYVMTDYLSGVGQSTQPEVTGRYARVTTASGSLNLRETASADAKVLLGIPKGTTLEVLSHADGWVKVTYSGSTGYVMDKFLTFTDQKPEETPTPTPPVEDNTSGVFVNTGGGTLNLRETANMTARVLAVIPDGTPVKLITRYSEWCKVRYGEISGYVMTKYLNINEDEERTPPYAWVNTSSGGLNLREEPSSDARVLTSIPQKAQVEVNILGTAWCKVTYQGVTGYVMTRYLNFEEQEAETGVRFVNTVSGGLNLREEPSADARVLTSIPQGTAVTLLQEGTEWCKIQYNDSIGYVMTKYLSKE